MLKFRCGRKRKRKMNNKNNKKRKRNKGRRKRKIGEGRRGKKKRTPRSVENIWIDNHSFENISM